MKLGTSRASRLVALAIVAGSAWGCSGDDPGYDAVFTNASGRTVLVAFENSLAVARMSSTTMVEVPASGRPFISPWIDMNWDAGWIKTDRPEVVGRIRLFRTDCSLIASFEVHLGRGPAIAIDRDGVATSIARASEQDPAQMQQTQTTFRTCPLPVGSANRA